MSDAIGSATIGDVQYVDVAVVGAGFAGLYLLHRLRKAGLGAVALEEADDVGGTWYWNRYPGRALRHPDHRLRLLVRRRTSRRRGHGRRNTPTQPEILRYLSFVADRYDLRRDIRFGTRVERARLGRRARAVAAQTDGGGERVVPLLRDGDRMPVGAKTAGRSTGVEDLQGRGLLHRALAARRRRPRRQARRGDRHRVVRHPVDPAARASRRRSSPCSSARRTSRCRRITVAPPADRAAKLAQDRDALRDEARWSMTGVPLALDRGL